MFVLKYVLDHSEWIPTQKNFSTKNLCLCHFSTSDPIFRKKCLNQVIMGKKFRNRDFRFWIRFGPFWIDSDPKKIFDQNFLSLPFFRPKMAKIWGFLKIFGRKKIFSKKFLYPLLDFYCGSFEPSLMCTFNIRWDILKWANLHLPAIIRSSWIWSDQTKNAIISSA